MRVGPWRQAILVQAPHFWDVGCRTSSWATSSLFHSRYAGQDDCGAFTLGVSHYPQHMDLVAFMFRHFPEQSSLQKHPWLTRVEQAVHRSHPPTNTRTHRSSAQSADQDIENHEQLSGSVGRTIIPRPHGLMAWRSCKSLAQCR